ncbi:tripartite tricarboxylate transporter substrate binding protein [Sporomusa sp. KB1]|jgi:tripartite-type tricarboxylate transporter receptor subunit TctC|uniref:tripartite tricarboxylate transporter substrate binding protein n=1 Tax=Sporomusa sp. KB1 TaxID=943346 RepID=UPI0011AA29BA|nr:tripartite tricarboxylate transporter substrate binding protein [Sporomusa sp. KB1]TWH51723.1 tripartite-type tricarboxylate transporter receptor subunit TctC [Sporomusa sp. KB1]
MEEKSICISEVPFKPITIIVPTTAGGSPDLTVRLMEKAAIKHLGQPLIVANIPGKEATVDKNKLADTNPDGYTISAIATDIALQPLYGSVEYYYSTMLEPLAQISSLPVVAAVLAENPWQNINELVNFAKEHSGEINYGHTGIGTPNHVVGELFAKEAGITITPVPFNEGSEAIQALVDGHIQLVFTDLSQVKHLVESGKTKVLSIATEQRLADPLFKAVPTFKEQDLAVVFSLWLGVGAPKGLSKDVKEKLVERIKLIAHDEVIKKDLGNLGITIEYLGSQEFDEKWNSETEHLPKAVKETEIAELIAAK